MLVCFAGKFLLTPEMGSFYSKKTQLPNGDLFIDNNNQTFWLGSRWVLGLGFRSGPKSKPNFFLGLTNSEFNSIHFGVEINKSLKERYGVSIEFVPLCSFSAV